MWDKYYEGGTTPEEEEGIRNELDASGEDLPERAIFAYYNNQRSPVPDAMEGYLFSRMEENTKKKRIRYLLWPLASAAVLVLAFTLYTGYLEQQRNSKNLQMMEQALSALSWSLQPEPEEPAMLVLWVDNHVEVIIN